MPLLDHFHPPTSRRHPWESFHTLWTAEIARTLNRGVLQAGLYAAAQVTLGGRIEVDVATLERDELGQAHAENNGGGAAVATWAPPVATLVMPAVFPDEFEVLVFKTSGGDALVGAIELVSPGNKDRPESRRVFAAKCATYLQWGVGLVIVDIVTDRLANLHNELIRLLEKPERFEYSKTSNLYTTAYRPNRTKSGDQVEIWQFPTELGQELSIVPLALRGIGTIPVDLESTYRSTCEDARL